MSATPYPKRLIEVDLPIARISVHARREKSIRHGHISTLHIWWARRPLAACRAVICAALWPDPVDLSAWLEKGEEVPAGDSVIRPARFLDTAQKCMIDWGKRHLSKASPESYSTFIKVQQGTTAFDEPAELRRALLDFIADFSNWDNATDKAYLETARKLTQAAHEALGGEEGTRPLVVDPFAGGGSIPLEALRVGADAFASDINPVAVTLNVIIEANDLGRDAIRDYATAAQNVERRLAASPQTTFAKFWARTLQCEGPSCGVEIPLIRSGQISIRGRYALEFRRTKKGDVEVEPAGDKAVHNRPILSVVSGTSASRESTCRNGSVTCPVCNFTHTQSQVARQALEKGFGRRLTAIGERLGETKRYRSPTIVEEQQSNSDTQYHDNIVSNCLAVPINPKRPSPAARGMSAVTRYGYAEFRQLFSPNQVDLLESVRVAILEEVSSVRPSVAPAVEILLAVTLDRLAAFQNTFCRWAPKGEHPVPPFGKNGFPMIWDYVEANPFGDSAGSWRGAAEWVTRVLEHLADSRSHAGVIELSDSQVQILPNDSAEAWITDPPYYDSYPYADLSDFFYPILKASLHDSKHSISRYFFDQLTPKDEELVLQPSRLTAGGPKDHNYYRAGMTKAFNVGRVVTRRDGIAVIVFANKTTGGWEALLSSVWDAGWTVTASWPIDTERESRTSGQARLQSSVHLVCRPRENADGSVRNEVGDWRDVLAELPRRIHEWMPRLAEEGVVGADAIFACLGPALEIFSRYSRVEKSSGEAVPLREYLEEVWAAVSKEALSMIFKDADTAGLEPDARLTAMWLWTLGGGAPAEDGEAEVAGETEADDEESGKAAKTTGFVLEFDAARKIAQGLGIHLEKASSVVEVKGETARLLSVAERTKHLFSKEGDDQTGKAGRKKKEPAQRSLFAELEAVEKSAGTAPSSKVPTPAPGATVLDQVHQAMILFAAGRGEAMKRFLVEDGVGKNAAFWKLAQSLSALYPPGGDEKRWVDGVLARKKGLGL